VYAFERPINDALWYGAGLSQGLERGSVGSSPDVLAYPAPLEPPPDAPPSPPALAPAVSEAVRTVTMALKSP
jgi:hypothetical protein